MRGNAFPHGRTRACRRDGRFAEWVVWGVDTVGHVESGEAAARRGAACSAVAVRRRCRPQDSARRAAGDAGGRDGC
ncbi:hypothetical protein Sme01_55620 [Sphaerisporangium melleum]|uniref:Uncharacterized protein n=1 Tax=Sphaerisporangium melleum TaxID=321316 RepID=A0A917RPT6_9ACTN|nr:hypothetical protein GCM10007964_70060 [Sphaerisporangium melleum]GII73086.1 hypothetical protein Sme01_55620 [Sphaerisporangium melleum]